MPELPDVAGFQRYLEDTALHTRISRVEIRDERIVQGVSTQKLRRELNGHELTSTHRHGKYLFARTDEAGWLVLHFGMTGALSLVQRGEEPRFTRFLLEFSDASCLAYESQRMLGQVSWTDEPGRFIEPHDLGPDALAEDLDASAFIGVMRGRRGLIKAALMDQSIVAGIGNVYADEILFQAGLHPKTTWPQLDEGDLKSLYRVMRRVLRVAARRGSRIDRLPSGYLLKERNAGAQRCPRCHAALQRGTFAGRTSYFCARCQPPR